MNDYKAKLRVMFLKANEQKLVAQNLPKRVFASKHFVERLQSRRIYLKMDFFNKSANIQNLLDIQVTQDDKVTYLFRAKAENGKHYYFVVGTNGRILTVWMESKKQRGANSPIHTTDFNIYKNAI